MIVDRESSVLLYPERNPYGAGPAHPRAITAKVDETAKGKPALDTSSTWGAAVSAGTPGAGPTGGSPGVVVSRGYREEMEDFAFCVRQWQGLKGADYYKQRLPRCHGKVAMEDAIIALTANQAMHGLESDEKGEKKETSAGAHRVQGGMVRRQQPGRRPRRRHEAENPGVRSANPFAVFLFLPRSQTLFGNLVRETLFSRDPKG